MASCRGSSGVRTDAPLESGWAALVTRSSEPSPAPGGPETSLRRRGGERKGAPAT
jgi:hypothetical protein